MLGTNLSRNLFSCTKNLIRMAIVFAGKLVYTVVQALLFSPQALLFCKTLVVFRCYRKTQYMTP